MIAVISFSLAGLLALSFLVTNEIKKSGLFLVFFISCLGLAGYSVQADYLAYLLVYLGVIVTVMAISLSVTLIEKETFAIKRPPRGIPLVCSGIFIVAVFGVLVLTVEKNKNNMMGVHFQHIPYKSLFSSMKNEYMISMGLMAVSVFLGLVCVMLLSRESKK